jgi:hypothetical protein
MGWGREAEEINIVTGEMYAGRWIVNVSACFV